MEDLLLDVTVADGKYRIIQHKTGLVEALRYGETWLKVTALPGSNMILAMAHEIEELRQKTISNEAAIAVGEDAFRAGFNVAVNELNNPGRPYGAEWAEVEDRAWSNYQPPEHIKALV